MSAFRFPFPRTTTIDLLSGYWLFSLAHNFVTFQPHSPLDLLCEQRIHASTLFGFQTATAFYPSQYIVQREYKFYFCISLKHFGTFCVSATEEMIVLPYEGGHDGLAGLGL